MDEKGIKIELPDKDNIMEFKIKIMPYDGYYKDGTCAPAPLPPCRHTLPPLLDCAFRRRSFGTRASHR